MQNPHPHQNTATEKILPEIETATTSKTSARGKTETKAFVVKSDEVSNTLSNDLKSASVPKQIFKTKTTQQEYVSSQASIIASLLKENVVPFKLETISKINAILDDLSSHNNKVSMFLDNKT